MRVLFLGVGSAFDEKHTNTSMVLKADNMNILLDCGYAVPHALWKFNEDPEFIDAVWISHQHADHLMGLPPFITRMKQSGRENPLYILCQPGLEQKIREVINIGYPDTIEKAAFEVRFITFDKEAELGNLKISTADTVHPVSNKAIRITDGEKTFCYSGDGEFTDDTRELFKECNLLVQECFSVDDEIDGHANLKDLAEEKTRLHIEKAAAVHIRRDIRLLEEVNEFAESHQIIIPEEGDLIEI